MVNDHQIDITGAPFALPAGAAAPSKPVVLQMNREDFPNAFLRDLKNIAARPLSSTTVVPATASVPGTLYQPVAQVVHVAVVQLNCHTVGSPRLDPTKVLSAGLVVRRIPRIGGIPQLSDPPDTAWPWMKDSNGLFGWGAPAPWTPCDDPDPTKRPQLKSGRADLDLLLAQKALSTAMTEVSSPAFVAAPDICNGAGMTLAYGLVPTASSEASTQQPPSVPAIDNGSLLKILPNLLKCGHHSSPQAGKQVTYQYMSDDYAKANGASDFLCFSATMRLLYTTFGAFDGSAGAGTLLNELNKHQVKFPASSGLPPQGMGDFYQEAATKLIDYDPNANPPATVPQLLMPTHWDKLSTTDQNDLLGVMTPLIQSRGIAAYPPQGRYQDASRLYRVRMFFRVKGDTPSCPPKLVWSCYSDPFRFAAWYESAGRPSPPVPLPDPMDKNALKAAKPASSFAVPPSLMGAIQGASLTGLSSGTPPAGGGGGVSIAWICSFSIPLITICAFFVLNIFISLLNIVFFWMIFIKICIPFPIPSPSSGQKD